MSFLDGLQQTTPKKEAEVDFPQNVLEETNQSCKERLDNKSLFTGDDENSTYNLSVDNIDRIFNADTNNERNFLDNRVWSDDYLDFRWDKKLDEECNISEKQPSLSDFQDFKDPSPKNSLSYIDSRLQESPGLDNINITAPICKKIAKTKNDAINNLRNEFIFPKKSNKFCLSTKNKNRNNQRTIAIPEESSEPFNELNNMINYLQKNYSKSHLFTYQNPNKYVQIGDNIFPFSTKALTGESEKGDEFDYTFGDMKNFKKVTNIRKHIYEDCFLFDIVDRFPREKLHSLDFKVKINYFICYLKSLGSSQAYKFASHICEYICSMNKPSINIEQPLCADKFDKSSYKIFYKKVGKITKDYIISKPYFTRIKMYDLKTGDDIQVGSRVSKSILSYLGIEENPSIHDGFKGLKFFYSILITNFIDSWLCRFGCSEHLNSYINQDPRIEPPDVKWEGYIEMNGNEKKKHIFTMWDDKWQEGGQFYAEHWIVLNAMHTT